MPVVENAWLEVQRSLEGCIYQRAALIRGNTVYIMSLLVNTIKLMRNWLFLAVSYANNSHLRENA